MNSNGIGELVDSKATESLQFIDLVLLRGIIDLTTSLNKSPTGIQLIQFINQFLSDHNITEARATPITSNYKLLGHIDKLRRFGYMMDSEGMKTSYQVTEKANGLFRNIPENPLKWFVVAPFEKGKVDLKKAVYLSK